MTRAHPTRRRAQPAETWPALRYRGHIVGLDVLRGVGVLMVVLYHAYNIDAGGTQWHGFAAAWIAITSLGHLGVHLFFVLSGFLITGILLDGRGAPRAARQFYTRRARRILPAYLVLLAALWLTHMVHARFVLAALLFVANMGRLVGARLAEFSSLWSLAVEEQFYLIWPWIAWRTRPQAVRRTIVLCLVLASLLRLMHFFLGQDTYFKTWVNVDYLMYGALVAHCLRSGVLQPGNLRRVTWWTYAGAGSAILLLAAIWTRAADQPWALAFFASVGRLPAMLLFVALLLSSVLAHQSAEQGGTGSGRVEAPAAPLQAIGRGMRLLPARLLIFLGYISYGLYLVHMLVFGLYDRYVVGTALAGYARSFRLLTVRAVLCSALSILLAWLSRSTLEAWFLRRSAGFRTPLRRGL